MGCKGSTTKFCRYSLNKGVCYEKDCSLGFHVRGTNTRVAREKAEEAHKKTLPFQWGRGENSPHLPAPRNPGDLEKVLGKPASSENRAPRKSNVGNPAKEMTEEEWERVHAARNQEHGHPQTADKTATFLGQLLIQGLMQCLQPKQDKETKMMPSLNLEQLMKCFTTVQ